MQSVILSSTVTCPQCDFSKKEHMPINSCQFFYECINCLCLLKPKQVDCCIFCSYGDVSCPPVQEDSCC
ncbi:MAG TPA: GDCCVxC domain-containing (seleno)protein [Gammaproteobacteria bacterium]|nr:GDCCVxC domain-containing (seleno)protein [Gammaproteobacteria bacterium]